MKSIKIKIFLIGLIYLGLMNTPNISFAESQVVVQEGEIIVETLPNNPQPYEDVTINISSFATDLNKAIITWKINYVTAISGIGKTSYSFKAGAQDTPTIVTIGIKPVGVMGEIEKTIKITPSEIEIMWEAVDGYTPPFYKGKTLPVVGGRVKAVAIPSTKTIKTGVGSVTYTWKNNGETNLDTSGYNKNSYIFKNNMFDEKSEITVMASSVNGDYSAEKTVNIPMFQPLLIFYKKSPTEGTLYNSALNKETSLVEDEMTIIAEPYFTTFGNQGNDFLFSWKINGDSIQTPVKKNELTVRPTARGGYATINLNIENTQELFQKISNSLKLNL